jgi:hypothetical protein
MALLPELVDETLVHLRHDNQALRNCSLVAKSWTHPSQKLLYADVRVTPSTYQTWEEIASPASTELLQHVHSLTCYHFNSLHEFHEDYLKSFHHLQCLTLYGIGSIEPNALDLFLAFQNTLSSLSLILVSFNLDTFIGLLGYFPRLRVLCFDHSKFQTEHRTVAPPSTPPRGTLRLTLSSDRDASILLRGLCELDLEYDQLEIHEVRRNASPVHSLISACEKTLTHLELGLNDCKL